MQHGNILTMPAAKSGFLPGVLFMLPPRMMP
jgi:hypothetical protein